MAPVHCVAIVTPAPGKEARLREILTELGNNIEKHEKEVSTYQVFEQYDGENGNVFVVRELYENEAAHEAHFKTSYFVELKRFLAEEQVLGAPLDIKKIRPFAGFASR
ncbi:hypothetical protein EYC80_007406 [Monilinia laxa]|uniref:ABM domain-containing protein n=1 Tax=Monilinia laxa TaxID=61186 RepID=A0A5N6JVF1_MONLA|nr:hypothetical protein EYC80_007406 [Monilinia laxa]